MNTQNTPLKTSLEIEENLNQQGPYIKRLLQRDSNILSFIFENFSEKVEAQLLALWWNLGSKQNFEDYIREFKNKITLLIFYQEITGAPLTRCMKSYSCLADFCVQKTLDRCGLKKDIVVLGLGKLGGEELNYGSDIDIIFIAKDDNLEQLKKVENVIRILDEVREGGRVFRVDLRLRPEGSVGPIVQALTTMLTYYLEWGREWERSMLLKARRVAGDKELGRHFLERIDPFIYRRSLDYRAIDALRNMKAAIESEADTDQIFGAPKELAKSSLSLRLSKKLGKQKRKQTRKLTNEKKSDTENNSDVLGWDIKIGRGGIREIEFFIQALQLVHAGRHPRLRTTNSIKALRRLFAEGLLSESDSDALSEAYLFFRELEHRVQMCEGKQTHQLPVSPEGFQALALRLQKKTHDLEHEIIEHRNFVYSRFSLLFSEGEKTANKPTVDIDSRWSSLLQNRADRRPSYQQQIRIFTAHNFARPKDAVHHLKILQAKHFGPFNKGGYLANYCLSCCAQSPDASMAFGNLVRFFQRVGDRPGYYSMLADNPHATRLLIHVFGISRSFSNGFISDPNLFARLITAGSVKVFREQHEMDLDLQNQLQYIEDIEHRLGVIRHFKNTEELRIALHYIGGVSKESETFSQLAKLADIIVLSFLKEIYEPMRQQKGKDFLLPPIEDLPFGIIALGKWGSQELSFSSDLDLMFVYEKLRQYRLGHDFFAKLASRLMRQLSSPSLGSILYEVDARLRPSGNKGPLVVGLKALQDHYTQSELWERQALLRARALPGKLESKFQSLRKEIVFKGGKHNYDSDETRNYISKMLKSIVASKFVPMTRNPKFQPGGLVFVEFTLQYLQLKHGVDGRDVGNIIDELQHVLGKSKKDKKVNSYLKHIFSEYQFLRKIEAYLKIAHAHSSEIPKESGELEALARRIEFQGQDYKTRFIERYDRAIDMLLEFHNVVFQI